MRDIERLTLLAGHVASVANAINKFAQQLDLLYGKDPKEEKELTKLISGLSFVAEHLLEELEEVSDTVFSSIRRSA